MPSLLGVAGKNSAFHYKIVHIFQFKIWSRLSFHETIKKRRHGDTFSVVLKTLTKAKWQGISTTNNSVKRIKQQGYFSLITDFSTWRHFQISKDFSAFIQFFPFATKTTKEILNCQGHLITVIFPPLIFPSNCELRFSTIFAH